MGYIMQMIELKLLENNNGQINGVNKNPRDLTSDGFELAKKSISEFPEMLDVRSLVVVPNADTYVVIGGNQRLRAMQALGYTNAPCHVVDWSAEKINEFIIKDNLEYGKWDFELLANEWDCDLLTEWGMEIPNEVFDDNINEKDLSDNINSTFKLEIECVDELSLQELYEELNNRRELKCRILTL